MESNNGHDNRGEDPHFPHLPYLVGGEHAFTPPLGMQYMGHVTTNGKDDEEHMHDPEYHPRPDDPDGDMLPKRKRRRQALSCSECKRRKIKCDRNQPCEACTKRGEPHRCDWTVLEPQEKYVNRGEFEDLQSKFDALEHIVAQMTGRPPGGIYHGHHFPPPPWMVSIEDPNAGPSTEPELSTTPDQSPKKEAGADTK